MLDQGAVVRASGTCALWARLHGARGEFWQHSRGWALWRASGVSQPQECWLRVRGRQLPSTEGERQSGRVF